MLSAEIFLSLMAFLIRIAATDVDNQVLGQPNKVFLLQMASNQRRFFRIGPVYHACMSYSRSVPEVMKYIPGPAINTDINVNASFTADKLKSVKSYFDITDY